MENEKVILTDVTGRDGFQMEDWVETEDKVRIINEIIAAGVKRIEATSFVSPRAVPQLKDAKEVIKQINRENVRVITLIPNVRGAEFALESDVDEVNVVVSVSETHNRKNVNNTVDESIAGIAEINRLMQSGGKKVNVGLATTFGCPFEGLYEVDRVTEVINKLTAKGLNSFMLADTTGMANPLQVSSFVNSLKADFPDVGLSLHLHNTRGMGLANVLAGYEAGIRNFDASLGGIGGCPFAPGATGNVALEDVAHMFDQMNIPIDPDLNKLIAAARDLEQVLGYKLPGQVMKAGQSTDLHQV
ncbi:hydroxymethylglutaryl-CoA lyase [Oceanobacillus damuensis]|uniref:hydroxymethylglutaryl-CoA lyase n=1 Tax=Oceanobacillus damuensis TaxID=937928 RepID=UPI0008373A61|nr:hydroxymethylglutaryl-CoA lyase [Oceanobacillus damuensis]